MSEIRAYKHKNNGTVISVDTYVYVEDNSLWVPLVEQHITHDQVIEWLIEHDCTVIAEGVAKAKGWTPPQAKQPPPPEFQPGDYVEVPGTTAGIYILKKISSIDPVLNHIHMDDGTFWTECRHAPSWLNPESGEHPAITGSAPLGRVYLTDEGPILVFNAGRWFRLPGVE